MILCRSYNEPGLLGLTTVYKTDLLSVKSLQFVYRK